jgi:putative membrane protein
MRSAFRFGSSFVLALAIAWSGIAGAADNMTDTSTNTTTSSTSNTTSNENSAHEILSNIHTTNQLEIRMAKLARQKAESPKVKDFAQRMIKDHTMADQKVMKLAKQEGVKVGQYPLTAMQQGQIDKLMASSGEEFDRLYMETNRTGHHKAIEMLESAKNKATDPKVKNLVTQLLPTVEHHEQLAQEIHPDTAKSSS